MNNDFINDKTFLLKVNQYRVREYLASIICLDFETELPIAELSSKIISGNFSIAAKSATRRTGSFSVIYDDETYSMTEVTNLIAIDKKISFSIGIKNPFFHTKEYHKYGEVLWFQQGIFIITGCSASISNSGATLSLNFIDKAGYLNGVCGGTLPATVRFHDKIYIDKNGDQVTEYPLIREIISEAVNHFGGEHPSRIFIEDVPDVGRQLVEYKGDTPFYLRTDGDSGKSFLLTTPASSEINNYKKYNKNDLIGYMETPLTYPGELVQRAGATVTSVLDAIVQTLGNFEYFYDVNGNFHFRRIKNYQATGNTPLLDIKTNDTDNTVQSLYFPRYTNYEYYNEFADSSLITQVSFQPKLDNIKNDFICWGTKNDSNNNAKMVRYHLAIDERPVDYPMKTDYAARSLCHEDIYAIYDVKAGNDIPIRYQINGIVSNNERAMLYVRSLDYYFPASKNYKESARFNWREELYRRALLAYGSSTRGSEYDEELMAEWRNIYDPENTTFKTKWEEKYGANTWTGYTVDTVVAPNKLRYWLDIIDTNSELGKYSIKRIGKRTKVIENSKINEVFAIDPPDIVYILNDYMEASVQEQRNLNLQKMIEDINYYISIGQDFALVNKATAENFSFINSFGTCYEEVRSMLFSNLLYNASVSLSCIPILYLDVNSVVRLNLRENNIVGDYVINNISYSIGQNGGTMSLQLSEAAIII